MVVPNNIQSGPGALTAAYSGRSLHGMLVGDFLKDLIHSGQFFSDAAMINKIIVHPSSDQLK